MDVSAARLWEIDGRSVSVRGFLAVGFIEIHDDQGETEPQVFAASTMEPSEATRHSAEF